MLAICGRLGFVWYMDRLGGGSIAEGGFNLVDVVETQGDSAYVLDDWDEDISGSARHDG